MIGRGNESVNDEDQLWPDGAIRHGAEEHWPATGTKGFVNGTKDSTGLTHLGAREYDLTLGRFTTVDPGARCQRSAAAHAYGYGASNPVTFADPTGERVVDDDRVSGAVGGFGWGIARLIARDVKLMARAIAARNAEAMAGTAAKGKTYTGSRNRLTGKVAGAMSGHGGCAEPNACGRTGLTQRNPNARFSRAAHWEYLEHGDARQVFASRRSRKTVVAQGRSLWSRRMPVTGARPAASGSSTKMALARRRAVVGRPRARGRRRRPI